jgi:hypothetical protein
VIKQTLRYYRQLAAEVPSLRTVAVSEPDALSAAKELHARTYRRLNLAPADAFTSDGRNIGLAYDPYQTHAQYFIVQDFSDRDFSDQGFSDQDLSDQDAHDSPPRTVATVRVIFADPGSGLDSFPMFRKGRPLYPRYRKLLEAADPAACGEISGLVREPGTSGKAALMLYRAVWHHALSQGYECLLVLCKVRLYPRCKMIFGKSWIRVGPSYVREGNVHEIPVMINVRTSLDEALTLSRVNPLKRHIKLKALRFFLRGLPEEVILPAHRAKLDRYRLDTAPAFAPPRSLAPGRPS